MGGIPWVRTMTEESATGTGGREGDLGVSNQGLTLVLIVRSVLLVLIASAILARYLVAP